MSISTTATKDSYAGNNSIVTQYPITFKYFEESHISVYFDGVLQTKGAGADYVMGGDGTTSTGYITTNVAQAGTVTVAITLDVPFDQPVVLQETGSLPAKTIEVEGFDRLNMQVRRVWRKLQDVLTFSSDESNGSTGTADNLIGFDGSGDIAEIPNSTFLQTANDLSDVDAATARTNLGVDAAGTRFALSELTDATITNPVSGETLEWNGSAWINQVSGTSVTISDTAPVSPDNGDLWFDSTSTQLFVYYADTDTSQWVSAMATSAPVVTSSDTPPTTPVSGDLWFDSSTSQMYVYYNDGSSSQWVTVTSGSPSPSSDTVSVKDFGAVGDGVADDTVAITNAFTEAGSSGLICHVPAGDYKITSTVTWDITNHFHVECSPDAEFIADSSFTVDTKFFNPTASASNQSLTWRGGKLNGSSLPARVSGAPDLLYINSANQSKVHIENVDFLINSDRTGTAGDSCLFLAAGEDYYVHNCRFTGAFDAAIYVSGDSSETTGRRCIITDNVISECQEAGIISKRSFEDHIISNNIVYNTDIGIVMGGEADTTKLPAKKSVINGNLLKNIQRGIEVKINDGCVVSGNRIEDYGINSSGTPVADYGIRLRGSNNCSVTGNVLIVGSAITPAGIGIALNRYTYNAVDYDSKENLIVGNNIKNVATAFSEGATADENVYYNNLVNDRTTLYSGSSTNSLFSAYDGDSGIELTSRGVSGQNPQSAVDFFTETDDDLIFHYCTPDDKKIQWFIGDATSQVRARFLYDHLNDRWAWRAGGSAEVFKINEYGAQVQGYTTSTLPATAPEGTLAYDSTLNKLAIKTAASGGWETVTSA